MRGTSRRVIAAAVAGVIAVTAAPVAAEAHGRHQSSFKKVGYFTQWGIYDRNYQVAKVQSSGQAAGLTHINYAFGPVTAAGVCASADPWADWQIPFPAELSVDGVADVAGQPFAGNLNQFAELKKKNPKLKVMISLGGWTGSAHFSDAALTDASRKKLVSSCVDLWIKGNLTDLPAGVAAGVFDGIDLDWEWPGSEGNPGNGIRPEDKQNFTLLSAEFRRQLDALGRKTRKHYELTAFLPANPPTIEAGFEAKKLSRILDFATVQGYDFHGAWDPKTNQQSAIFVPKGSPDAVDNSLDIAVNALIKDGAPRGWLVAGVPFYGRGWTGPDVSTMFASPATPAPAPYENGNEDYYRLKSFLEDPALKYKLHRDLRAGHAYIENGTTFWTYDDPFQMLQKTVYIRAKGLGGAMAWSLDGDANGSLTKAIHAGLR